MRKQSETEKPPEKKQDSVKIEQCSNSENVSVSIAGKTKVSQSKAIAEVIDQNHNSPCKTGKVSIAHVTNQSVVMDTQESVISSSDIKVMAKADDVMERSDSTLSPVSEVWFKFIWFFVWM